jgi:hypothetical protein
MENLIISILKQRRIFSNISQKDYCKMICKKTSREQKKAEKILSQVLHWITTGIFLHDFITLKYPEQNKEEEN